MLTAGDFFTAGMDFKNTGEAALCVYHYNEARIYKLIDNPLLTLR